MTKRILRYFFDFTEGQEKWLNEMAAKGWRLIKCGQISYDFESCEPGEYEYAVEFVAEKPYSESKDYKAFLESMGYKTFYKNINVGIFIGKVKWRPWGEGAGQIVTAPGGLQKELIIVEKKKDGKVFNLHTDLTDSLTKHRKILIAYLFAAVSMFALAAMSLAFAIWQLAESVFIGAAICIFLAILCAVFGTAWLKPALRLLPKFRKLKDEAKTNEYQVPSMKKNIIVFCSVIAVSVLFGVGLFWLISAGGTYNSGSALMLNSSSGHDYWNASYKKLNGFRQRSISLDEGRHTFTIEITTESGELSLSIIGKDGTEYYKGIELPNSAFEVYVDLTAKEKLTLRVDAKSHSGSYKLKWD